MNRWKECLKHGMTLETKRNLAKCELSPKEYNEKQAIKYAQWLAARDGITIPRGKVQVVWDVFASANKTRERRLWSGQTEKTAAWCSRISAVQWGNDAERFNHRKDGRRGAWSHNEFVPELTIEIPHWDFEPGARRFTLHSPY